MNASRWPRACGDAVLSAIFRATPEDFRVEELPAFEASGAGEHLLLTVEKRGMNTVHAAKLIARWAGIPEMGVGYAGLKDRHAVTRQRFSVHIPKKTAPDPSALESNELRIIESHWHHRKLPRGALAGNRFEIVLRDVAGESAAIEQRLAAIRDHGIPNYFGEQRFGRNGDNVEAALRMFAGQRVRREERSILLSSARSEMFNAVLAARVADGSWRGGLEGEVWMLDGSQSVFGPEPLTPELLERASRRDIHPTGPMWGLGELRSTALVRDIEQSTALGLPGVAAGLEGAGLRQERRSLRINVQSLAWLRLDHASWWLSFVLPPGAYATNLLAELGCVTEGRSERGRQPLEGTCSG